MPPRPLNLSPARITNLQHPDAVKVINDLFQQVAAAVNHNAQAATPKRISGQSVLNFGTVGANSSVETIAHVNGATASLVASANPLVTLGSADVTWTAYITGTDEVTVKVTNPTGSSIAVNTVKWNILVS